MSDLTVNKQNFEESTPDNRMRVALLVEYYGKDYFGSQFQPEHETVQSAMQKALKKLGLSTSAVTFASRTDAKVNAQGQVAHFDCAPDALKNIPRLDYALNAVLPSSISIRDVAIDVGCHFHSRRDAEMKWYRYIIYNNSNRSVWASRQPATQYHIPLDVDLMHEAAQYLLGCHDFKSFKDPNTDVFDDLCDILYASVVRSGDFVIFDVAANRFLYKMVRNITGQLMLIGNSEKPLVPETMLKVMAARNRAEAAPTARPEGLTLMAIKHKPPFNFFAQDVYVQQFETMINQPEMESLQDENLFRKAS